MSGPTCLRVATEVVTEGNQLRGLKIETRAEKQVYMYMYTSVHTIMRKKVCTYALYSV